MGAETHNAGEFLASIIEQANDLRNRLDEVPDGVWPDLFAVIRQADSLVGDALDMLDADEDVIL